MKMQIDALKKENVRLIEQMSRVASQAEYYKNSTEEYLRITENNEDYKQKQLLFKKHLDEIKTSSSPINKRLRNFYVYIIKPI
jgi:hypothetical protein